ncbi:MAG: phosphatidylserine decarboxylase family protein [Mariprofundaceae bacterium]
MTNEKLLSGKPRGLIPLAREGWPFLGACAFLLVFSVTIDWWLLAGLLTIILALMLNFFRDPERNIPAGMNLYLAPADGKVLKADTGEQGGRVDIFMDVFNVHVNRAPMNGRIVHMQYFPGKFVNASFDKASEHNERNRIELETGQDESCAITQIAGLIARRIVSYVAVGDRVIAGQRVGMIRFGSRVNCEIPPGYTLLIRPGQKVKAGETILARKVDQDG